MIISKTQVQGILKLYARDYRIDRVDSPAKAQGVFKRDELMISDASRLKQKAMQAAKEAEDIRLDRVAGLQQRIFAGTYVLADDEVAEKMIHRAIVDELA